jgi:hypothetical protein
MHIFRLNFRLNPPVTFLIWDSEDYAALLSLRLQFEKFVIQVSSIGLAHVEESGDVLGPRLRPSILSVEPPDYPSSFYPHLILIF